MNIKYKIKYSDKYIDIDGNWIGMLVFSVACTYKY